MRIFSWNVNGLRAVVKSGAFDHFLATCQPDVLCLQETKINQDTLANSEIQEKYSDYEQFYSFASRKGYSGTAIWVKRSAPEMPTDERIQSTTTDELSKTNLSDQYGNLADEGRLTVLNFGDFFLISVYVPNAKENLSRLGLRQKWDRALAEMIKKLDKPVVICGDFNVAHQEIDLARPKDNIGRHGFTDQERAGFKNLLRIANLHDIFRDQNPDKTGAYTWWSHWGNARANNVGWRIDYFLISETLVKNAKNPEIFPDIRGSDHCPISLEII